MNNIEKYKSLIGRQATVFYLTDKPIHTTIQDVELLESGEVFIIMGEDKVETRWFYPQEVFIDGVAIERGEI